MNERRSSYRLDFDRWAFILELIVINYDRTMNLLQIAREYLERGPSGCPLIFDKDLEGMINKLTNNPITKLDYLKRNQQLNEREVEWLRMGIMHYMSPKVSRIFHRLAN
jgi:hypothetical protein